MDRGLDLSAQNSAMMETREDAASAHVKQQFFTKMTIRQKFKLCLLKLKSQFRKGSSCRSDQVYDAIMEYSGDQTACNTPAASVVHADSGINTCAASCDVTQNNTEFKGNQVDEEINQIDISPAIENVNEWICNVAVHCVDITNMELLETAPLVWEPSTITKSDVVEPQSLQATLKPKKSSKSIKSQKSGGLERKATSASRKTQRTLERKVTHADKPSIMENEPSLNRINTTSTRRKCRSRSILKKSESTRDLKPLVDLTTMDVPSTANQPSFTKGSLLDQVYSPNVNQNLKRAKSVMDLKLSKSNLERNLSVKDVKRRNKKVVVETSTTGMVWNEDEIPLFDLVMMRSQSSAYKTIV